MFLEYSGRDDELFIINLVELHNIKGNLV